jgi:8-oxo-dGTP diphosphatase
MPIHVVAAIIKYHNKYLIARRSAHKSLVGYWEFPGGKVEENENPEEALVREIMVEMSLEIKVVSYLATSEYTYDFGTILLEGHLCELMGELPEVVVSSDHDLIEMVTLEAFRAYKWAPADVALVAALEDLD